MNRWEFAHELAAAKVFKRPPCTMIYDPPFYPYCVPEPVVNFDLNYK